MWAQILGYLTLVSIFLTTGYAGHYLYHAGKERRPWLLKVPVPKPAGEFVLSSGSDYVGSV